MKYKATGFKPDKRKQYKLTTGKLANMCIVEKIRAGQQEGITALAKVIGCSRQKLYDYARGRNDLSLLTFVKYMRAMGYNVVLVPEEEKTVEYDTDPDIDIPLMREKNITRAEVFQLLDMWYGDTLNQEKLADALGISQPFISAAINKRK